MSSNQFDISNKENNPTRANIFDALSQLEPDIKSESAYSRSNTQQLEDLSTDGTSKANTSKNWRLENIEPLNMKLTPSAEQHAHEYETHFPTLGQPVETLKPETDFRPELLSPVNIVASQVHVESATESAPATENVTTEWTSELKDPSFIEVKPHRHSTKKAEEEEEVLEPEEPSEPVEPVVVQPEIIQLERPPAEKPVAKPVIIQAPTIAPAKKWDELDEGSESKEAQVEETPIVESEPLKQSNPAKANIFQALSQLGPKISEDASESSISRGNTAEEIPVPKPVETKFVKPRLGISVTPAVEEHAHEYESHFPTLGEEQTLQPETEFKPEILSPVNIVAESILSGDFTEVKPNRRAPAKNISEEPEEIITEPEVSEAPAVTRSQVIQLDRSTTQEKPVAKPAIYEAPTIAPAKEWSELAKEAEKEVKVEVTPDLAKKSEKYEKLFPSLGEEPKDLGSETEFRREILNPINIVVAEAHGETPKVAINPEALNAPKPYYNDLDPIEEKIETQDDDVKPHAKRGLRSSLEHLHEDNVMNQSTELTLSAGRIDLIREELRENETRALSKDLIFQDVERALVVVRDLEKGGQYGEAIRLLKKNLETLDARFMHNDTFDLNEMNKLLFELNLQLAGCYHHINEISYAIDHARAAMKFKSDSPKAIYLLGTGLLRAGQLEQGYDILKQIRRIPLPGGDGYEELIEHELRIYERRAQEVLKDIEEPVKEEKGASAWAGLGAFAGTALAGGITSWFAMRNYLGLSEKKSLIYSVGAGTVVGGLSLILMGHNNKVK